MAYVLILGYNSASKVDRCVLSKPVSRLDQSRDHQRLSEDRTTLSIEGTKPFTVWDVSTAAS